MKSDDDGFLSRWARRKADVRRGVVEPAPASVEPQPIIPARPSMPAAGLPAATVPVSPSDAPPAAAGAASSGVPTTRSSPAAAGGAPVAVAPAAPLPTLDDVALLTRGSDFSRFVQPGVASGVKNAALKKLFSDPHYNIMDGLDTYIDDYGKPDPIPLAMLRQMNQSKALGLFDHEEKEAAAAALAATEEARAALLPEPAASPDGAAPVVVAESIPTPEADPPASEPEPRPDDDADLRLQQDDDTRRSGPEPGPRT